MRYMKSGKGHWTGWTLSLTLAVALGTQAPLAAEGEETVKQRLDRWQTMSPEERRDEWKDMSPEERAAAKKEVRENYDSLSPEQKEAIEKRRAKHREAKGDRKAEKE